MPSPPDTVVAALADALAADPGRPLVTFFDGATGERIELSVKTFDNWVSKVANFFSDELGLDAGATVRVDLPAHWQSTVTLMAVWAAGLRVALDGAADDIAASVVGPDSRTDLAAVEGQPIACSLRALGGPFVEPLPDGWLDFGREVPPQPDVLLMPGLVQGGDVALETSTGAITHAQLVEHAASTAADLGLVPGGGLITDANPTRSSQLAAGLVAPLVAGARVVLVAHADAPTRDRIAEEERATAVLWLTG